MRADVHSVAPVQLYLIRVGETMVLRQFRHPDNQIVVHTEQVDEWTQAITIEKPLPYVTLVTQRVLAESRIAMGLLRRHGYRVVEADLSLRAYRYVRPLPLWAIHWCVVRVDRRTWEAIRWLHQHGFVRLTVGEGMRVGFRDLRPWPMKGR